MESRKDRKNLAASMIPPIPQRAPPRRIPALLPRCRPARPSSPSLHSSAAAYLHPSSAVSPSPCSFAAPGRRLRPFPYPPLPSARRSPLMPRPAPADRHLHRRSLLASGPTSPHRARPPAPLAAAPTAAVSASLAAPPPLTAPPPPPSAAVRRRHWMCRLRLPRPRLPFLLAHRPPWRRRVGGRRKVCCVTDRRDPYVIVNGKIE
ncbi:hypothetical protein BRADI_2g24905v3 [Brachypodium distachyon]|uniref:Uncharacterized protein n=1 Tax=Brachypodium distachyon TaxID=15368 RepID=A0A2K2DAA9_BRADI|nr:hypothetical protein BRADI_2g24905v3 [Brachypodium distachyon]